MIIEEIKIYKNYSILNKYFDGIYIRNLLKRNDRYIQLKYKIKKYKINCFIFRFDNCNNNKNIISLFNNYYKTPSITDNELKNGKYKMSINEYGYIFSTIEILKHSIKNNINNILLLDDDFILHNDINNLLPLKINKLPPWKLLFLGCSQWIPTKNINNDYYKPYKTCGTFAIALKDEYIEKYLNNLYTLHCPADNYPLWELFDNYSYVIIPNLIIADVTNSDLRDNRNQYETAKILGWNMNNYSFVLFNEIEILRNMIKDINLWGIFENDTLDFNIISKKINNKIVNKIIDFYGNNNKIKTKILLDLIYGYPEKKFVIIIPAYNVEKWCLKNIYSCLNQQYTNFRIIYIDDCSTDNTYNIIKNLNNNKISLYKQIKRQRQSSSKYIAINSCLDDEIVCILDGDDWFKHNQVLNLLNYEYSKNNIFLTYGSYEMFSSNENDYFTIINEQKIPIKLNQGKEYLKEVIENNTFRDTYFYGSHLKTFYAGLFKKIPIKYFLDDDNNFFKLSTDLCEMNCLLELAGKKQKFIPNILYVYNIENTNKYNTSFFKFGQNEYWTNYRYKTIKKIKYSKKLIPINSIYNNKHNNDYSITIDLMDNIPIVINKIEKYIDLNKIDFTIRLINEKLYKKYYYYLLFLKIKFKINFNTIFEKINIHIKKDSDIVFLNNIDILINHINSTQINQMYITNNINDIQHITFDKNVIVGITKWKQSFIGLNSIIKNNNINDNIILLHLI